MRNRNLKKLVMYTFAAVAAATGFALTAPEASAQCGVASWYGPGFAGKKTANGERYNPNAISAAHRSLPFGTRVTVKNQSNGRTLTLRINDRGPFVGGRIIDLSKGAARALGVSGLARVCIAHGGHVKQAGAKKRYRKARVAKAYGKKSRRVASRKSRGLRHSASRSAA